MVKNREIVHWRSIISMKNEVHGDNRDESEVNKTLF